MTEQEVRDIIRDELQELLASERYIFSKKIQILNGRNIELATDIGTRIGTTSSQKLSFHGVTPVAQASAISAPSGGSTIDAEARAAINSIRTVLTNKGLTA